MTTQCVQLANYARHHYNPGAVDLVWNPTLAQAAQESADYAAQHDCWNCHTNAGPGTTWGQNLFLSKRSCQDAYNGWVTTEAAGKDSVNLEEGHFKNVVGFAAPYRTIGKHPSSSPHTAMLAPPLLIIAAASFTHAWKSTFLGHYVPGLSAVQLATVQSCPGVEIVNGSPTCAQIADSQNITLNAFQNLNPSISCLIPVAEGSYVCVLAQDDAGATISFSTSAAGTSRATGTAKVTATVVATSPATSVAPSSGATSTSISPPATSATLTTSSSAEPEPKTTEPPAPKTTQPPAPKTTEQPPPRPKTTEQPPPPPPKTTEQPPPPPPKTTEQPPPPPPKTTQAPSPPPSSGGADPDIVRVQQPE
ncbi:hypothetical protein BC830DRAFT_1234704 [Chytriomyces sp. MP71]|nr:hypothetical protein BC830DRAFT_1234704 [Chytriomyces sp. MP71]